MKHYPSLVLRATTSLTLSVMFFALAIGTWAYQSDKLGISADVTVTQNRVSVNFDELVIPSDKFGLAFESQYQAYGIKFHSGTEIGSNSTTYTIPALVTNGAKIDSYVNSGAVGAIYNRARLLQQFQGSVFTTYPNALIGGRGGSASDLNMGPSSPIIMTFHDPNNPSEASTTDYVKFNVGVADAPEASLIIPNPAYTSIILPVGINFLDKDGNILGVRTLTSAGTHTVEFSGGAIAKVKIFSEPTNGQNQFTSFASWFGMDNLSFNLPATSAVTSATLTTDKTIYTTGETVTGTFKNTGTTGITCPSPLAYKIYQQAAGDASPTTLVFTSSGARDTQTLAASASQTVTWDQKMTGGTQAPAGTYSLQVECTGITKSATFTIQATTPAPVPDGTLTIEKPLYEPGEGVKFTLKNVGTVDITCPNAAPYIIQDVNGGIIYTPVGADVVETIAVGATKTWTWDQKNNSGVQVADGAYSVVVTCGPVRESGSFTIASFTPQTLDFTVTPTSGVAPLPVTGRFTGSNTPLTWDFGDGTTYVNAPATQGHTYQQAGVYTVTLRSGTALGTKQVTVTAPAATPTPPGPSIDKKVDTTKNTIPTARLVSTGGSLVFNLIVAGVLSAIATYMLVIRKREPHQIEN